MIDGVTSKPFSATTLPPPEVKTSHKLKIIGASRAKFSRPRTEVERNFMAKRVLESKHISGR
jgi:hypothetical protein